MASTVIAGSKPRGPGTQGIFAFAGAGEGVGFLTPFCLTVTGEVVSGGGGMNVTPAQVDGSLGEGTKRSTSFSGTVISN